MDPHSALSTLFTPAGRDNPYPVFAALRSSAPVHHDAELDTYVLTRFADCRYALGDPALLVPDLDWYARQDPGWHEHPGADFFYSSLLRRNGADHGRLRRLVAGAFSVRRVQALRAGVGNLADGFLDSFADACAAGGTADFQALVGYPLPVAVVGRLIGVPAGEQPDFQRLGHDAGRLLEPLRTARDWDLADRAVDTLRAYFAELVRRRRAEPADDLTTDLLRARDADDTRLDERELVDTLLLVLVAGYETTAGLLGLAVHALLTHPDQWRKLRERPALVPRAVEEAMRWDTPVQMTERIAARALVIGGVPVPAGANVTTVLAAAHRDPERHPEPDAFRVDRADVKVLGFGGGAHYCLGAALARLETAELLERLLIRFPTLSLAGGALRRTSISLRAFDVLPLSAHG
ncbi:cytochrome P450 [Streptomyces sp. NPDC007088]|uniref:cytochrome P450 n=1 Tax=Streptomyces sp. NPDC007088 TaxID=3364773 RepID=UPI00367C5BD2